MTANKVATGKATAGEGAISRKDRKRLIRKIKEASGVAMYALEEKLTDEQVIAASENLEILKLVKSANNYNRYSQGQKTAAANKKADEATKRLEEFLKLENSEILKTGRWLLNALTKRGKERHETLLEKDLVHKEDYNDTVGDMRDTIETMHEADAKLSKDAKQNIRMLERKIDALRKQQRQVRDYIRDTYGSSTWNAIANRFDIDPGEQSRRSS